MTTIRGERTGVADLQEELLGLDGVGSGVLNPTDLDRLRLMDTVKDQVQVQNVCRSRVRRRRECGGFRPLPWEFAQPSAVNQLDLEFNMVTNCQTDALLIERSGTHFEMEAQELLRQLKAANIAILSLIEVLFIATSSGTLRAAWVHCGGQRIRRNTSTISSGGGSALLVPTCSDKT